MPVPLGAEPDDSGPINRARRDFLIRCCQSASAALVPAKLHGLVSPFSNCLDSSYELTPAGDFHLHPRYRTPRPLDALLLKTKAGLDDFITEKYADDIAAILGKWSASLQRSPQDVQAIETVLALTFSGTSLHPLESQVVRPGPPIQSHEKRITLPDAPIRGRS